MGFRLAREENAVSLPPYWPGSKLGEKPIEDEGPVRGEVDVCQRPKEEDEDERPERTA